VGWTLGVETDETLDDITVESMPARRESILTKVREIAMAVASVSDILEAQQGMRRLER
jgi:hypothetical protein